VHGFAGRRLAVLRHVSVPLTFKKRIDPDKNPSGRVRHPSGASTIPPEDASNDREVAPTLRACPERSEGSADAGLKASATTESPKEENAPEISKSPEQSENVIENKGPAEETKA